MLYFSQKQLACLLHKTFYFFGASLYVSEHFQFGKLGGVGKGSWRKERLPSMQQKMGGKLRVSTVKSKMSTVFPAIVINLQSVGNVFNL